MADKAPKDTRIHHLYRITNTINGKVYIGRSIDTNSRWRSHRREAAQEKPVMAITRAIKKYGNNAFEFEVIAGCKTWEDANETETLLVQQYNSQVPNGYNVALGGINAPKSEEWKRKVSATLMGHSVSEETIRRLSDSHKGIRLTSEAKQKLSLALIGNTRHTGKPAWNKGIPCSEEQKQKMRKLTPEQEKSIVGDNRSSRILAKEYGVEKSTILEIRKRYKNKNKEQDDK